MQVDVGSGDSEHHADKMTDIPYTAPSKGGKSFNCPNCHAFAAQKNEQIVRRVPGGWQDLQGFTMTLCEHCHKPALWLKEAMIWPKAKSVVKAHADMPDDCIGDFDEAREIFSISPRGSAALLRLVVQKLMNHLGQGGKDINSAIGALVTLGMPVEIQQALDVCRVTGNEAVHPGSMNLNETPEEARALFQWVNMIVENRISQPKKLKAMFDNLPPEKLKGIEGRDKLKG